MIKATLLAITPLLAAFVDIYCQYAIALFQITLRRFHIAIFFASHMLIPHYAFSDGRHTLRHAATSPLIFLASSLSAFDASPLLPPLPLFRRAHADIFLLPLRCYVSLRHDFADTTYAYFDAIYAIIIAAIDARYFRLVTHCFLHTLPS